MPKCKNCGSEIQDGDMFCGYCGTRVEAVTETPQPAPERQTQQPAQPQQAHTETPHPVQVQPVVLKKVTLKSPIGELKNVKVGFSWTTFFWGGFVCLFRKDWIPGFIWLAVYLLSLYLNITSSFQSVLADLLMIVISISQIAGAFIYNKMYIKGLLAKGWKPYGPDDAYTLRQKGIWNK